MAEIPVERKEGGGFPWWLIPLILLLLLLPLLYFCSKQNNNAVATDTNGNMNANRTVVTTTGSANNAMTGANGAVGGNTAVVVNSNTGANMSNGNMSGANSGVAVTDVNMFGTTTEKASLVGRNVTLTDVAVDKVMSDHVFTVKSGTGEMFVFLDEALDSGGGKEQQIKPRPGNRINLGGTFRNVPTGEVKEETKEGGLNKNEYAQMKGQTVYLHATSLSDAK